MDRNQYLSFPMLDVPQTIALAQALVQAAPKTPESQRGRDRLREAIAQMISAWEQVPTKKTDKVTADNQLDAAWRALRDILAAFLQISPFEPALASKAQVAQEKVFGEEGMRFLLRPFSEEWVESSRRINRIDTDTEAKINDLGGAPVLAALRQAHDNYGVALGLSGEQGEVVERANLRTPLNGLRDAIQFHAIGVLYSASDEESEEIACAALRPLLDVK